MTTRSSVENVNSLVSKLQANPTVAADAFRKMLNDKANQKDVIRNNELSISVDNGSDNDRRVHIKTESSRVEFGQGTKAIADFVNARGGNALQQRYLDSPPGIRTQRFHSEVDMPLSDFEKIAGDLETSLNAVTKGVEPNTTPAAAVTKAVEPNTTPPAGRGLPTTDPESCALWKRLEVKMPGC